MNNNINTQATTFWNFLKGNTIEIPIIQRDYAQGRLGKENLRKNFLADLKNALDSGGAMKLDFVYGSIENGNLNPLDGQQRLTTLWLLHWYIALRAGELSEDNCKIFRKFTYETRISSREFCQNLCNSKHFENFDGNDIIGFITNQTWFYSAWKLDPTIQSMLRMLGGTKVTNKKNEDIVDGIEELFKCPSECFIEGKVYCFFKRYWEKLTSNNAPVVFYHLPLEDFGLSDDLYIKMNARGKQLTDFENFKADLIGYITKQAEDNPESEWKDLLDAKNGIPIKLDTDWTDIFWKNKSKESNIDEIYFAFINRYFLQELICAKKEDNTDLYSVDYLEKENVAFRHLYGEKGDDSRLQYSGLDKYPFSDDKVISHFLFTSFSDTLNNFKQDYSICKFFGACCLNAYFPTWVDSKFEFIPRYDETGNITTLGQKERVVFLAVCRFFEKGNFNNVLFKRWMRVVWNIVENSGIETISAMIGVMRLIDELSIHSHDIYTYLANDNNKINSNAAIVQVAEERAKAKQILKNVFSETEIIDAESHPLLKGCISAIFENDDCCSVPYGQSIQDRIELLKSLWNKDNDKDYTFVKVLISYYDKERPDGKLYLKKNQEYWKSLLTDKLKNSFRKIEKKDDKGDCIGWKSMLANTNLIENSRADGKIVSTYWDGKIVLWGTNGCTWNAYGNVILDEVHNNSILVKLVNNHKIECNQKIQNSEFFDGWNIDFKYQNYFFRWYCYPKDNNPNNDNRKELDVYLMMGDWKDYSPRKKKINDNNTENETHYCFRVTPEMEKYTTRFTTELDRLINEAKKNEDLQIIEEQ